MCSTSEEKNEKKVALSKESMVTTKRKTGKQIAKIKGFLQHADFVSNNNYKK